MRVEGLEYRTGRPWRGRGARGGGQDGQGWRGEEGWVLVLLVRPARPPLPACKPGPPHLFVSPAYLPCPPPGHGARFLQLHDATQQHLRAPPRVRRVRRCVPGSNSCVVPCTVSCVVPCTVSCVVPGSVSCVVPGSDSCVVVFCRGMQGWRMR